MELSAFNPYCFAIDTEFSSTGDSLFINEPREMADKTKGVYITTGANSTYRQIAHSKYGTDRLYWVLHYNNPGILLEPFEILPESISIFVPDLSLVTS